LIPQGDTAERQREGAGPRLAGVAAAVRAVDHGALLSYQAVADTWQITLERLGQLLAGQAIINDEQLHRVMIWLGHHPPLTAEQMLTERVRTAALTTASLAEQAGVGVEALGAVLALQPVAEWEAARLDGWLDRTARTV
jgi:hypothetical protein